MSEPADPRPPVRPLATVKSPLTPAPSTATGDAKTLCDRCGDEMYRMHAVWRCPSCGYKTDCCGW